MDKFPQAYQRFLRDVDTSDVETFHQLELTFGKWAGCKWHATGKQIRALEIEYRNRMGGWYHGWLMSRTGTPTRYGKRISRYMSRHPHATLKEARGHSKR